MKGMLGTVEMASPRAVPLKKRGKMKPPRKPETTVMLMQMSLTTAMRHSMCGV